MHAFIEHMLTNSQSMDALIPQLRNLTFTDRKEQKIEGKELWPLLEAGTFMYMHATMF